MTTQPSSKNYYLALGLGGVETDIAFGESATGGNNKVVVFKGKEDIPLTINQDLVSSISKNLDPLYPDGLELTLHGGVLGHVKKPNESESRKLIGVSFGAGFDISKLPLVGKYIPADQMIRIDKVQAFFSSAPWSAVETAELAKILPAGPVKLPQYLNQGGNFTFAVDLGGAQPQQISLAATDAPSRAPATAPNATPPRPATQPGVAFWLSVDKTMGLLTLRRVGARYYESRVHFMFDASLLIGPVTLSLEGLSVGTRLDRFDPVFNLDGVGLSYEKPGLQVSGGLLYNAITRSFSGRALIKTKTLTIAALGAYEEVNGNHSLFVYAVANRSIGVGPPCFEVTGMTAGFGYNRSVRIPEPEDVGRFALVAAAGNGSAIKDPMGALRTMERDLPATPGNLFFAIGVKFNTYKIVNSVALLIVRMGRQVQVDAVGLSTLTIPVGATGNDVQANVEIGWTARYNRDEGALQVRGAIDPQRSFVFSRKCKLSGQFAFYSWLEGPHAGDFVFTLGGYHPKFSPPSHYPRPAPLRFSWEVFRYKLDTSIIKGETSLNLSGSMYWALTPRAMMVGGILDAHYRFRTEISYDLSILGHDIAGVSLSGAVDARLTAKANFLISWQPFYYDAEIGLDIRISASLTGRAYLDLWLFTIDESVTKTFDLDLSANLRLWGPELSGRATVDWEIISFDIAFGEGSKSKPKAIDWATFESKFLPASENICTIGLENGGIRQLEGGGWVVNANELAITTHSVVPSTTVRAGTMFAETRAAAGIAPMDIATIAGATHTITVIDTENNDLDVTDNFSFATIKKNAPKAVWGSSFQPGLNDARLLNDMLMGVRIGPKAPAPPDVTTFKPISSFRYDVEPKENAYSWQAALAKGARVSNADLSGINSPITQTRRKALLDVLELDASNVRLSNFSDVFLV